MTHDAKKDAGSATDLRSGTLAKQNFTALESVIIYNLVHNIAFMHASLTGTSAGIKHKKSISKPPGVQQLPYCHLAHCAL